MTTNELKDKIQEEAKVKIRKNNYNCTVVLDMGSGKGKIGIDCIKEKNFKNILITSPRTNLKDMWSKELEKWGIYNWNMFGETNEYDVQCGPRINITLENIQTTYKWTKEKLSQFDFVISDEIHLCGEQYFTLIKNCQELNIPVLGLTGTPNKDDVFKRDVLYKTLPIVFEYYDSAKDGLINKRKYYIYQYELSDDYKVITGTKNKKWSVGESSQYTYLTEQIKKGQKLMAQTGSQDWFKDAAEWFWKGNGDSTQKNAARIYLQAIKYRREFLNNLTSSAVIANKLKDKILNSQITNKVLLFSELTSQAEKLSAYSIHSKQDEETNRQLLYMFDTGTIRELSAVRSLSLGLNLVGANYAIVESFNSSSVDLLQKIGRTSRLNAEDVANIVIIVPLKTQAEEWYQSFMKDILQRDEDSDITIINSIEDLKV